MTSTTAPASNVGLIRKAIAPTLPAVDALNAAIRAARRICARQRHTPVLVLCPKCGYVEATVAELEFGPAPYAAVQPTEPCYTCKQNQDGIY